MKKTKRGTRYIKRVELIPEEEFATLGVFQSMLSRFEEHTPFKGHGHDMRMVVTTPNGDLKTMEIGEIVCRKDDFVKAFSDGRTFCAVKMFWSDGSWEYGLKLWESKTRTYRRNCKLEPLFAKVGVVNEGTGEVEDIFDFDKSSRVPAWVMELLPRYNERIRDAIANRDKSVETDAISLSDWEQVDKVVCSEYMTTQAHWKEIPVGGKKAKLPINMAFDRRFWWKPAITEWKENICRDEWGTYSDMMEKGYVKVFCYTYFKSIYHNNCKRVKEYKLIPLSDVLMLKTRQWNGELHDFEEKEVWNSLDETCKGNV